MTRPLSGRRVPEHVDEQPAPGARQHARLLRRIDRHQTGPQNPAERGTGVDGCRPAERDARHQRPVTSRSRRAVAIRSDGGLPEIVSRMTRGSTAAIPSDASPSKSKNVVTGKLPGSPMPSGIGAPPMLLTRSTDAGLAAPVSVVSILRTAYSRAPRSRRPPAASLDRSPSIPCWKIATGGLAGAPLGSDQHERHGVDRLHGHAVVEHPHLPRGGRQIVGRGERPPPPARRAGAARLPDGGNPGRVVVTGPPKRSSSSGPG